MSRPALLRRPASCGHNDCASGPHPRRHHAVPPRRHRAQSVRLRVGGAEAPIPRCTLAIAGPQMRVQRTGCGGAIAIMEPFASRWLPSGGRLSIGALRCAAGAATGRHIVADNRRGSCSAHEGLAAACVPRRDATPILARPVRRRRWQRSPTVNQITPPVTTDQRPTAATKTQTSSHRVRAPREAQLGHRSRGMARRADSVHRRAICKERTVVRARRTGRRTPARDPPERRASGVHAGRDAHGNTALHVAAFVGPVNTVGALGSGLGPGCAGPIAGRS